MLVFTTVGSLNANQSGHAFTGSQQSAYEHPPDSNPRMPTLSETSYYGELELVESCIMKVGVVVCKSLVLLT